MAQYKGSIAGTVAGTHAIRRRGRRGGGSQTHKTPRALESLRKGL